MMKDTKQGLVFKHGTPALNKEPSLAKQQTMKGQSSGAPLAAARVRVPDNLSYDFVKDMLEDGESQKMSDHSSIYGDEDSKNKK